MKKYRCLYAICLAAVGLMTACTQDELADGDTLPEGLYPVEIASVSIGGESSVQPWGADAPQTRAVDGEYEGEIRTLWQEGDIFYTKFKDGDGIGSYTVTGIGGIDRGKTLYWRSTTQEETLVSWFTQPSLDADGGMLDISNQSERLAYVCRKEQPVKYGGDDITVVLEHQLAKVHVYVQGTGNEGNAKGVSINGVPVTCTVVEGEITTQSDQKGNIQMHKTTVDNAACFEANLLPEKSTLEKFAVSLGDNSPKEISLSNKLENPKKGKYYTVTLTLQKESTETIDLSKGNYEISGNGTYFFTGTGTHGIKVTSGSPTIYLANADISVASRHAIEVSGGTPTLIIQRNVNLQASAGAGIYVTSGSITIKSDRDNYRNNRLTARGGSDDTNVYPGIGGGESTTINLNNLYIEAHGSAKSDNHSPAIGVLQPINTTSPDPPKVNITNCYIWAYREVAPGSNYRKGYANHIGQGGNADNDHDGDASNAPYYPSLNLGGGTASNSTLEGWTNDYKHTSQSWY